MEISMSLSELFFIKAKFSDHTLNNNRNEVKFIKLF